MECRVRVLITAHIGVNIEKTPWTEYLSVNEIMKKLTSNGHLTETVCCGSSYHTSSTSGYRFACRQLFTTPMTSHSKTHRKFCNSCLKNKLLHQGRKYFVINDFENMMFSSEIDEDTGIECPTPIITGGIVISSPLNIECSRCNNNAFCSYKVNSYCRKCLQNGTDM